MHFNHQTVGVRSPAGVALLAAAALAGAVMAGPANAEDKQISVAFVSGPLNNSFFPPLYQGAQDAAKVLGVKLNYIPIDEGDIEASSARTMQVAIAHKTLPCCLSPRRRIAL